MIHFDNVSKIYDKSDTYALEDINLKINKGEFIFLIGQSGAGKSTLIKLLQRETKVSQGNLTVGGIDVSALSTRTIPEYRRNIGMVFQDFRLLNNKTVYENIAFAMEILSKKKDLIQELVPKVLELVDLEEKLYSYPDELSGGEQQRVAIARAIVNKPPILIADEPTGNLDIQNSIQIINLLNAINKQGTTVIVATHSKEIVDRMKKRVIHLQYGRIVSDTVRGKYFNE